MQTLSWWPAIQVRRSALLLVACVCLAGNKGAGEIPLHTGPERARDHLRVSYADPFQEAIGQFRNGDETQRSEAGQHFLSLLKQLYAYQEQGLAPFVALPFWGGGIDNLAEDLRKDIASQIAAATHGNEVLDAAQWLIDSDPLDANEVAGLVIVRKTETPQSDAIIRAILAAPHHNSRVLLDALHEGELRKLPIGPEIRALCNSYRTSIREAARRAAGEMGITDIPPFQPENAISPWLDQQLRDFARMVFPEVPQSARWTRFTTDENDPEIYGAGIRNKEFSGWLLGESAGKLRIIDYFGQYSEVDKLHIKTSPRTFAEDAALFARRTALDPTSPQDKWKFHSGLSRRGLLTGQFEPTFVSTPEALLAAWSYQAGDRKLAASILFPCIDEATDDRDFVHAVRDLLANVYHQRMLEAFSYRRDYAEVLSLAQHLSKPIFDGYFYQQRAKELAAQLAKRTDDFKAFVLPSPSRWREMKEKMDRPAQIQFLAAHLRLLNCLQISQPGSVNFLDPQSANPVWFGGEMQVINPYEELANMAMTPTDLPTLAPFLENENFMPTFGYWRDFHPGRELYRVDYAVARLVNKRAGQELIKLGDYRSLNPEEKKQYLQQTKESWRQGQTKSPSPP